MIGGVSKGHPDEKDIAAAIEFLITKRKLVCPHCGAHKYCKKVLTK